MPQWVLLAGGAVVILIVVVVVVIVAMSLGGGSSGKGEVPKTNAPTTKPGAAPKTNGTPKIKRPTSIDDTSSLVKPCPLAGNSLGSPSICS